MWTGPTREGSSADHVEASRLTQAKDSSRKGIKTVGGPEPNVILDMTFLRFSDSVKVIW